MVDRTRHGFERRELRNGSRRKDRGFPRVLIPILTAPGTSDFLSNGERVAGYILDLPSEFISDPTALTNAFSIVSLNHSAVHPYP